MPKPKFELNAVKFNEATSDSYINILNELSLIEVGNYYKKMQTLLLKEIKAQSAPSKTKFKKLFGKQIQCKQYTLKHWIWSFSSLQWDIKVWALVSTEGVNWEYDTNCKDKLKVLKFILDLRTYIAKN